MTLIGVVCGSASAQVSTPKVPPPPPDTLMVESSTLQSPQVVTVVHRMNGIKALALLRRDGEAVTMVDDDLVTASYAVTSITAGFVLADGQSVVARLPQAEAEVEATATGYSYSLLSPAPKAATPAQPASRAATAAATSPRALLLPEAAGFVVVQSNGKQFAARYIGLDGGSGLSLLKITGLKVPVTRDASEEQLAVGQLVRLFAPVRVIKASSTPQATVALRVGEIEGKITEITRTSTGKIARLTVHAPNLSAKIVGGVALNKAGEAVGIVEASSAQAAHLIPVASVRRAAERVLARQASVPRPWLGIRGEPVSATSLEKFFFSGWSAQEAALLKGKQEGILLTSVAPGTPAALANLKAGDVIVRVNDFKIKSAEDFSYMLNEAGSGATVNFTVFRGQTPVPPTLFTPVMPPMTIQVPQPALPPEAFNFKPFDISVKLGEALNPARAMRSAEEYAKAVRDINPLPVVARGIETAALSQKAAAHLGARSGMLVLYVDSESAAAQAGLRVFDVIETVEGKLVGRNPFSYMLPTGNPRRLTLGVVRDHRKVEITIQQKDTPKR